MSADRISIRLSADARRHLSKLASYERRSESAVLRSALQDYLRARGKLESFSAAAKRLGLLGIVKNAPPDLSTGKRHMQGFGRS